MEPKDILRIQAAIRRIDYLQTISVDDIIVNYEIRSAVLRSLKEIGESVTHSEDFPDESFSIELIEKYEDRIPLKQASQVRHNLIHNYYFLFHEQYSETVLQNVKNVIIRDLPILKRQLTGLLQLEQHTGLEIDDSGTGKKSSSSDEMISISITYPAIPFPSILPPIPNLLQVVVEEKKESKTNKRRKISDKPKSTLNSADYLTIGRLELKKLMLLREQCGNEANFKEKVLENQTFRYAVENCILTSTLFSASD